MRTPRRREKKIVAEETRTRQYTLLESGPEPRRLVKVRKSQAENHGTQWHCEIHGTQFAEFCEHIVAVMAHRWSVSGKP